MADFGKAPPPAFLPAPGDHAILWDHWLLLFEDYLLATGHTGLAEDRKYTLQKCCLSAEGQRILATITLVDTSYASAVTALKSHFSAGRSKRMHSYEFRQRAQRPGETLSWFACALRELVKCCEFGPLEDELILNQLIEKMSYYQLKERLLLEPDSVALADALKIGKQLESALLETRELDCSVHGGVTSSPLSAQAVAQVMGGAAELVTVCSDVQRVTDKSLMESGL